MSWERLKLRELAATLEDRQLIAGLGAPIKSGKEASDYRCASHPTTGGPDLALKVYRPIEHRGFRNDAVYWEGSEAVRKGAGNTREARALRKSSRFGRRYAAATWVEHEWRVLNRLWHHGLPVPRPVHLADGAILMELFTTAAGEPAPPLLGGDLARDVAAGLFASLCEVVDAMLALGLVHADLSPYNVLWNGEQYRVIDFPQAVDARFNRSARELLLRDVTRLAEFFARFGAAAAPGAVAEELWARYQPG
jgi:RIO kinase 1